MVWVNTSPLVKTYTLQEFWDLPEPPDHSKLELIAGVLYMTPPPGHTHDNAVSRLNRLLSEYLIKSGDKGTLGPAGILISNPICFMFPPKRRRSSSPITAQLRILLWKLFHWVRRFTTAIRRLILTLRLGWRNYGLLTRFMRRWRSVASTVNAMLWAPRSRRARNCVRSYYRN